MSKHPSIAKITRPRLAEVLPRPRLFRLLDQGRYPVTWVSGPAGSGKTTLVASYLDARQLPCLWYQINEGDADIASFFYYMGLAARTAAPRYRKSLPLLTPEYLQGISTFTQRFFETFYSRLKTPFTIVFDNYQEAPEESSFHEVINGGLSLLPDGIRVFVLSRNEPPAPFMRLRANNAMHQVGWDELRFTLEESKKIIRMKDRRPGIDLAELHDKTQGWAAGLVLLTEGGGTRTSEPQSTGELDPDAVFAYFAGEIFDKLDSETRDFLLMTSFLPKVTVESAEKLTDQENAGRILSGLSRNHFFTVKHSTVEPTYEYHPLFREFLLARMKEALNPEGVLRVQKRAAALLEESGQIEDAAALYLASQDWEHLVRLILSHAQALVVQGRSKTVEQWIAGIPDIVRQENPWLLYWLGICKMTVDLHKSRGQLEQAFRIFKDREDVTGIYLSWSGIIDTFVLEWGGFKPLDYWITEFETLQRQYPEFPSPEIEALVTNGMFCALMYRQPHHPELPQWAERATAIALATTDIRLKTFISSNLILYYSWWRGETAMASLLVDKLRKHASTDDLDPLSQITWTATAAANTWITAENDRSLSLVKSGLDLAQITGVHLWDFMLLTQGCLVALNLGDIESAGDYLRRMSYVTHAGRKGDIINYNWQMGCKLLYEEKFAMALQHMQTAVSIAREGGFTMGLGGMLDGVIEASIELGDFDMAWCTLVEARSIALEIKSRTLEYQSYWLEALYHLRTETRNKAIVAIHRNLALGREYGIFNHAQWRSKVMGELYVLALEEGIEVEYVRKMIRLHRMVPNQTDTYIESWPWPLKFYALGQFKIERDGKQVVFPVKVQKKPLELLKALIAFGGKEVSEAQLIDTLWPDREGDAGYRSFITTLQRLRHLLNHKDAIQLQGGRMSLDPRYCWVDTWAFEDITRKTELAWKEGKSTEAIRLTEKAIDLYRGPFLENYFEEDKAVSLRESLRTKFLRSIKRLGRYHEQAEEWEGAAEAYQRGLESDNLDEELYRALMICYRNMGRTAEVLRVYDRCRKTLETSLGVEPSPETEAVYKGLPGINARNREK
jgi:LuxR family maltose regulon positive regulatory protein